MESSFVREVQTILQKDGLGGELCLDGIFGSETEAALKAFQVL